MKDWKRVTKAKPCEICGKPDWCIVAPDRAVAICTRISDGSIKQCGEAGYLHRLNGQAAREPEKPQSRRLSQKVNWKLILASCAVSPERIAPHANQLGVTVESLVQLDIGFQGNGEWVFPMRDEKFNVIGIRVRTEQGHKFAHYGSRNGMFVPSNFDKAQRVFVCEGPSDTAALLSVGLMAVGRASCSTCVSMLVALLDRCDVVVVADNDKPGIDGAKVLSEALDSQVIRTAPYKDARDAIKNGWRPE